jgi:hypothetical protein
LLLSQAFSVGIPRWMGFRLSGSLSHEPFSFFTMEFRRSQSLFMNFSFTWWNLGYYGAFSRIFLSQGGILAITEPFHEFFFHVESRLLRSLFTNFSFTWWNLGYHGAFSRIFLSHGGILKRDTRCGGRLFSYI